MEEICNTVREFLINTLSEYLTVLETEDTPLVPLSADTVIIGYIDIDRNVQSTVCFIVPDIQTCAELSIEEQEVTTQLDVWFFVRKAIPAVLYRQALRYGTAMKKAILDNWTLDGVVAEVKIGEVEYFADVGAADKTVQAVRLGMTILTTES